MIRNTFSLVSVIILFLVGALSEAQAQSNWPGFLKNWDMGYGYSKTWGTYERNVKAVSGDGKLIVSDTLMNVSSNKGFTGQSGTSFNLKRLGRTSQLALGVTGIYNMYVWDYPTANGATLIDNAIKYDYTSGLLFSGATLNAGMAISADFKFGSEAMMDKIYHWSWTGGIGVLPSINLTADFTNADMSFGVQPFIKTEVGYRGPIVAKLRLLYSFGNLTYLNVTDKSGYFGIAGSESTTKLIGNGNFSVSLLVMPFSFMYKRSNWLNTY